MKKIIVDLLAEVENKKVESINNSVIFTVEELNKVFSTSEINVLEDEINSLNFDYGISADWQFDFDEVTETQESCLIIIVQDRDKYSKLIGQVLPKNKPQMGYVYIFSEGLVVDTIKNMISYGDDNYMNLRMRNSSSGLFLLTLLEKSPNPVSVDELHSILGGSSTDTAKSYSVGEARKYLRKRMLEELKIPTQLFDELIKLVSGDGYKIGLEFKKTV